MNQGKMEKKEERERKDVRMEVKMNTKRKTDINVSEVEDGMEGVRKKHGIEK